jgi:hypothetical protein
VLVVGAPGDRSRAGYVDGDEFDMLGGGYGNTELDYSIAGNGSAYVFELGPWPPINPTTHAWHEAAYLKAPTSDSVDAFGKTVAISGDYIAIGAPGESSQDPDNQADNMATASGAAYLFHHSTSGWSASSYLKASNLVAGAGFGCHLGLDQSRLVVGNCVHFDPATFDQEHHGKVAAFDF